MPPKIHGHGLQLPYRSEVTHEFCRRTLFFGDCDSEPPDKIFEHLDEFGGYIRSNGFSTKHCQGGDVEEVLLLAVALLAAGRFVEQWRQDRKRKQQGIEGEFPPELAGESIP